MAVSLDLKDRKILHQLDLDCRQSNAQIGKKVRLSKQVVDYRIKKLMKDEIITSFYPHINISKLGYGAHKIYIHFSSLTAAKEQQVWNYLVRHQHIIWAIACSGKWDVVFGIASKGIEEFNSILDGFMNKFSSFIVDRAISVFNQATLHQRKWILPSKKISYFQLGGKTQNFSLDTIDQGLLRMLEKNARSAIMDMAHILSISSSLVIQRIKRLRAKGILEGFRVGINRKKLGIHYCKAFVYYQHKHSQKEKELLEYCYSLRNIYGVSQSIGPWDLELEFEVTHYDDFHNIMKQMKNTFTLIKKFDTVYIEKEYGESFLLL